MAHQTPLTHPDARGVAAPAQAPVLACAADDAYARPLAVTLYSAIVNYLGTAIPRLFIVDGGVRPANRARIERVLGSIGECIEWLKPDVQLVQHLTVSDRYPASIYLRLLLPLLLPPDIEKAIYLDSDIVVTGNIGELWLADLGKYVILAAQDEGARTVGSPWGLSNYRELGLTASAMYFNSGVLVLHLPRWRERRITQRVIQYAATHSAMMRFGEQDAMNAVLARSWGRLDSRWNQLVSPWKGHDGRHYGPGIMHFVSACKPWNPSGAHWTNSIYDDYLKRSAWFTRLEWWRYYLSLMVRRQHVEQLRAHERRLAAKQSGAVIEPDQATPLPTATHHGRSSSQHGETCVIVSNS